MNVVHNDWSLVVGEVGVGDVVEYLEKLYHHQYIVEHIVDGLVRTDETMQRLKADHFEPLLVEVRLLVVIFRIVLVGRHCRIEKFVFLKLIIPINEHSIAWINFRFFNHQINIPHTTQFHKRCFVHNPIWWCLRYRIYNRLLKVSYFWQAGRQTQIYHFLQKINKSKRKKTIISV